MRHQVDMRSLHARRRLQRRLDMMLARRTGHPQHRQRHRLLNSGRHRTKAIKNYYCSSRAAYPALASAAIARSTGAGSTSERTRAAPICTSWTFRLSSTLSVCVTRRTQEPQCIPSMRNVNSDNLSPLLIVDDTSAKMMQRRPSWVRAITIGCSHTWTEVLQIERYREVFLP